KSPRRRSRGTAGRAESSALECALADGPSPPSLRARAMPQLIRTAAFCLAALLLAACQKDFSAYALTTTGKVIQFNTKKPGTINSTVNISGLATNQSVVAMAYRPSDGQLYCITNDGFLCTLDPSSGLAAVVGTVPFTQNLGSGNNSVRLSNPVISFDPVADQLRVITADYN